MTLFDWVKVYLPLETAEPGGWWQTKDLGLGSETYRITVDGELERLHREPFGHEPGVTRVRWIAMPEWAGELRFYRLVRSEGAARRTERWLEYVAEVENGRVKSLRPAAAPIR